MPEANRHLSRTIQPVENQMAPSTGKKKLSGIGHIPALPLSADLIDRISEKKKRILANRYNKRDPVEQRLLQILALFCGCTGKTEILKSMKALISDPAVKKEVSFSSLNSLYDGLLKTGLIEYAASRPRLTPELLFPLITMLREAGCLTEMLRIFERAVPAGLPDLPSWRKAEQKQFDLLLRELLLSLLEKNPERLQKTLDHYTARRQQYRNFDDPVLYLLARTGDAEGFLRILDRNTQVYLAEHIAAYLTDRGLSPSPPAADFLSAVADLPDLASKNRDTFQNLLAGAALLRGDMEQLALLTACMQPLENAAWRGVQAFLFQKNEEALAAFDEAVAMLKRKSRKRNLFLPGLPGIFYLLALMQSGSDHHMEAARCMAGFGRKNKENALSNIFGLMEIVISYRIHSPLADEALIHWRVGGDGMGGLFSLFYFLALHWCGKKPRDYFFPHYMDLFRAYFERFGFHWIWHEARITLSVLGHEPKKLDRDFFKERGILCLTDLFPREEEWIKNLTALERLANPPAAGEERNAKAASRVIWHIHIHPSHTNFSLVPRLLTRTKTGGWSKGRNIAIKRLLKEPETVEGLTEQDRQVCKSIQEVFHYHNSANYIFRKDAILDLVGHPHVYIASEPDTRVDLAEGRPGLSLTETGDGQVRLAFSHPLDPDQRVQVIRENADRLVVVRMDERLSQMVRLVKSGLTVPAAGKDRLLAAAARLAGMASLASEMPGVGKDAIPVEPDPTPVIRLRPLGEGLRVEIQVHPFSPGGPSCPPGEGGDTLICRIDGEARRTVRDKNEEIRRANAVLAACPALTTSDTDTDEVWTWNLPRAEDSLELLLQLESMKDEIRLFWPEGETLRMKGEADLTQFSISIHKKKDWFAVSGELAVDESEVMTMTELLALMENSPGRFIQLKSGGFLALTKRFRQRLEEIADWSEAAGKGDENRKFHPLAALMLEDMAGETAGFSADKSWKEQLRRLTDARNLQPAVPSTLKGKLRDYQEEGFAWLARLAHWGAGACLADDMGLGKTIQALSLILTRAARGPVLVVAPVSVCMNWEAEAARFAPTLRPLQLGAADREAIIAGLEPFDLLLVSYGLLQQDSVADLLAGVNFEIIVLDEAQAIKNADTKRSKAAMRLSGECRIITTGTPVENHLGELWNLFRFLNPGLLGSRESFSRKFAVPIERDGDRRVRRRLKRLIQPFLLRRTKHQVLEELPERTDILLKVDLSPGETAFYEALRRNALERLAKEGPDSPMIALAEIMKLRRACCHPRLAAPGLDLPGAKLAVFENLVEDLMAGGHKALVFSQFTDHLAIIRETVEEKGLSYQYLDGSTPAKKRKERVDAFQAGEGTLFLISLKAGGTGLNLTAADYVIHMDPWWNPAVEDQASDRAHRIGQDRPVTVYSLVARHTIEEKIVALHREKRDLADSLLDGADMSGRMTAEELIALIREG